MKKTVVTFLIIGFVFGAVYALTNYYSGSWTLFMYYSENPDTSKQVFQISGINSKDNCLNNGDILKKEGQSYECGHDCRMDQYGLTICKTVCDRGGCKN